MAIKTISKDIQKEYRLRIIKAKDAVEKNNGKSLTELYNDKEQRLSDAAQLKTPDRVPVNIQTGVFALRYLGVPLSAMYYDHAAFRAASLITALEFDADTGGAALFGNSGVSMELLDTKNAAWPGGNLPPDRPYQFVEGEYMKAEEYDIFLNDPSDFVLRYYLPRVYGLLAPLPKLPPFRNVIGGFGIQELASIFASRDFRKIGRVLIEIDKQQARLREEEAEFIDDLVNLGFPPEYVGGRGGGGMVTGTTTGVTGVGVGGAPFDTISDFLRGMRGTMLDMRRCPDKLLAACDKIYEWRLARAVPFTPDSRGNPRRVFMALHRGSDGFMSVKDFEKFYWPTLKKAILKTVELGAVAAPFWEGIWDQRLEYLRDFPKGKVIFWTENTDIIRAKDIIGDRMCYPGRYASDLASGWYAGRYRRALQEAHQEGGQEWRIHPRSQQCDGLRQT